jgi:hypothetical protein
MELPRFANCISDSDPAERMNDLVETEEPTFTKSRIEALPPSFAWGPRIDNEDPRFVKSKIEALPAKTALLRTESDEPICE